VTTLEAECNREGGSVSVVMLAQFQGDMEKKDAEIISLKQATTNCRQETISVKQLCAGDFRRRATPGHQVTELAHEC
jgi:hypothetical protein